MIHMLDHLQRLHERCEEEADRAQASKPFPTLQHISARISEDVEQFLRQLHKNKFFKMVKLGKSFHQ